MDDLDDILDEFAGPAVPLKPVDAPAAVQGKPSRIPVPSAAASSYNSSSSLSSTSKEKEKATGALSNDAFGDEDGDDFERQLALGMEKLLANLSASNAESNTDEPDFDAQKVKETMDALLGSIPRAASSSQSQKKTTSKPKGQNPVNFQSAVSDTLSQLKESKEKVETELKEAEDVPEDMEAMMKELEEMMGSADFENMFGDVMNQLMSRDLLYEPLKDLSAKYPEYLQSNKANISTEEYARFNSQYLIVKKIVQTYDDSSITGDAEQKRVTELMQQMQELGNPPESLMQGMVPGMQMGPDGLPQFSPGMEGGNGECNIM
ncbi:Peroxisome chaperone and import receptor [Entophlyctis luteolus]|nr:Peroxisome chaperone and import receptor [Entophlyctis luteolus]KAJ3347664.1 Peroxisome chaperone and import receptor [Entophlyctis luteolus]KAJ3383790.1 Peroxisome chaperone and import receptor [Entophlyctis sp. JEL0112]